MEKATNYMISLLTVGTMILATMNFTGSLNMPWAYFLIPVACLVGILLYAMYQDKKAKDKGES